MNSETTQWWEVLFTIPNLVAFCISAWNLRDAGRDLTFLVRKRINGLRQGHARTAWDAEFYRLCTTGAFVLIGLAAMTVPFNPAPQSALSRGVTTLVAMFLAALAVWGVVRMRGLRDYVRQGEAQKERQMANAADGVVKVEVVHGESLPPNPLVRLVHMRKFWLLLFAVVQTLVATYFQVPPLVWGSIDGLVMFVVYQMTQEDIAEKSAAPTINNVAPALDLNEFSVEFTDAEWQRLAVVMMPRLVAWLAANEVSLEGAATTPAPITASEQPG